MNKVFLQFVSFLSIIFIGQSVYADKAYVLFLSKSTPEYYVLNQFDVTHKPSWNSIQTEQLPQKDFYLGSLWKVFAYAYLKQNEIQVLPQPCHSLQSFAVALDEALVQSCQFAFSKFVEKIDSKKWQHFWKIKLSSNYEVWVSNVLTDKEFSQVSPIKILRVFQSIQNFSIFSDLRNVLKNVSYNGTAQNLKVFYPDTNFIIKTFTMGDRKKGYVGGFAGWLDSNTLVWLYGYDKSYKVAYKWYEALVDKRKDIKSKNAYHDTLRVCSDFLYDTKIVKIIDQNKKEIYHGNLFGEYKILTDKNDKISFVSRGEFSIQKNKENRLKLQGCFSLENYIARVLQREADIMSYQTRKALSFIARTYLIQNADFKNRKTYFIPDSTRWQRVSLQYPNLENLAIAESTAGLILKQSPVYYHLNRNKDDTLNLTQAERMAKSGSSFSVILQRFFPGFEVTPLWSLKNLECQNFKLAQAWLGHNKIRWKRILGPMGLDLAKSVSICMQNESQPFYFNGKIYMNDFDTTEDQITLVHEWLHALTENTKYAEDEKSIERLAKRLVLGEGM